MTVATTEDIAPLERLHVPDDLSGEAGAFRALADRCGIDASTDRQAILAWLSAKAGGSALTQASYRRESERLLLWSVLQRGKALSSLNVDDALAYAEFLADPQPEERWIGPKAANRDSEIWRPFAGPLSPSSRRQALVVVGGLLEWLVSVGYVIANPFAGIAKRVEASAGGPVGAMERGLERTLPPAALEAVLDELGTLEASGRNRRTAISLRLLLETGMRISELVNARREHLERHPSGWVLRVPSRRGSMRDAALSTRLAEDLERYLSARGLPSGLSNVPPGAHLIGPADDLGARLGAPGDGVGQLAIHRDLGALFERVATRLKTRGDSDLAEQVRRATSGWLRHADALTAVRS